MPGTYKLTCRVCGDSTHFENLNSAANVGWTEVAPLGGFIKSDTVEHFAYCPGHAAAEDTEPHDG